MLLLPVLKRTRDSQNERTMRRMIRSARVPVFALSVCGALGFGASTALAGPLEGKQFCDRLAIGTCQNLTQCQQKCASRGYPAEGATCDRGCCYCPI
jgi:hypothetical protein